MAETTGEIPAAGEAEDLDNDDRLGVKTRGGFSAIIAEGLEPK